MKFLVLIALVCVATIVSKLALVEACECSCGCNCAASDALEWSLFKRQHGKSYVSAEEEARRLNNFLVTKTLVERHNEDETQSYKMGLNHMADWTQEELNKLTGLKADSRFYQLDERSEMTFENRAFVNGLLNADTPLPEEVDWRKVPGVVTEVKDQGQCGACWAFATTGLLEGQQLKRNLTSRLISLSEMNIVECSDDNLGCGGGMPDRALSDIAKMGGLESEADYPYHDEEAPCSFNKTKVVMTVAGPIVMKDTSEEDLKKVVARYGPVAIAIYATNSLVAYKSGIFHDRHCKRGEINHGVLLVGYGSDSQAGDYWIVKNSWKKSWGEEGYFRMRRGIEMCSITLYPTIAKF